MQLKPHGSVGTWTLADFMGLVPPWPRLAVNQTWALSRRSLDTTRNTQGPVTTLDCRSSFGELLRQAGAGRDEGWPGRLVELNEIIRVLMRANYSCRGNIPWQLTLLSPDRSSKRASVNPRGETLESTWQGTDIFRGFRHPRPWGKSTEWWMTVEIRDPLFTVTVHFSPNLPSPGPNHDYGCALQKSARKSLHGELSLTI